MLVARDPLDDLMAERDIAYRPGNVTRAATATIWRDGWRAAMARVETCLLAGDLDGLSREVALALTENRSRPRQGKFDA